MSPSRDIKLSTPQGSCLSKLSPSLHMFFKEILAFFPPGRPSTKADFYINRSPSVSLHTCFEKKYSIKSRNILGVWKRQGKTHGVVANRLTTLYARHWLSISWFLNMLKTGMEHSPLRLVQTRLYVPECPPPLWIPKPHQKKIPISSHSVTRRTAADHTLSANQKHLSLPAYQKRWDKLLFYWATN